MLSSTKKRWNHVFCCNLGGVRENCFTQNKSETEEQITYDLMCDVKEKQKNRGKSCGL